MDELQLPKGLTLVDDAKAPKGASPSAPNTSDVQLPKGLTLVGESTPSATAPIQAKAVPEVPNGLTLMPSHAVGAPATGEISAEPPRTRLQKMRESLANSAFGHALEGTMPAVADALNLRPTLAQGASGSQQRADYEESKTLDPAGQLLRAGAPDLYHAATFPVRIFMSDKSPSAKKLIQSYALSMNPNDPENRLEGITMPPLMHGQHSTQITPEQMTEMYQKVIAPAGEAGAEFLGGMSTPKNVAMLGGFKLVPTTTKAGLIFHAATGAYFAQEMGRGGYRQAAQAYSEANDGNVPDAVKDAVSAALSLGMAGEGAWGMSKMREYHGKTVEEAWERNAPKRTIRDCTQASRKAAYEAERERTIKEIVTTLRAKVDARQKEVREAQEAQQKQIKATHEAAQQEQESQRQQGRDQRPVRRSAAAREKQAKGKLAAEVQASREDAQQRRAEAENQVQQEPQRPIAAIRDEHGNVSHPADLQGQTNLFSVHEEDGKLYVTRTTGEGETARTEWLDVHGNFVSEPQELFSTDDPATASTLARLSSAKTTADSLAWEPDATPEQVSDADELNRIRRDLTAGELSARDAQRQARIGERVKLDDEFEAARKSQLNGPYHESSGREFVAQLEEEARNAGLSDEEVNHLVENAGVLAQQQTESNLHHVARSGDSIISKRGVRWILDAKGMLRPDNGASPVPLMKNGFYSRQAVQLAQSGRVGYGRASYEAVQEARNAKRITYDGPNPREVAREKLEELAYEAGYGNGEDYLRAKGAKRSQDVSGDTRSPKEAARARLEEVARQAGFANANEYLRAHGAKPDAESSADGQSAKDAARAKLEEMAYQAGYGNAEDYLRARRLEDAAYELGYGNAADMERAAYELGFGNADDLLRFKASQRVPEGQPPRVTHEKELVEQVKERAEGKVEDPEPVTPEQAHEQAAAAEQRQRAARAEAIRAVVESQNPAPGQSEEQAQQAVVKAEEAISVAKDAAAQTAEAKGKATPRAQEEFPKRAPVTIGLRGNAGVIEQNNKQFKFHYELVPIESAVVSHFWVGDRLEKNPEFFEPLQPREPNEAQTFNRRTDAQLFAVDPETGVTSGYNFAKYANPTIDALSGPPVVEQGGMVVSGNGRMQRLLKHLQVLDEISDPNLRNGLKLELEGKMRKLASDSGIAQYPRDGKFCVVVRMLDEEIGTVGKASELGLLFNTSEAEPINDAAKGLVYGRTFDDDIVKKIGRMVEDSEGGLEAAMRADPYYFAQLVGERFGIPPSQRSEWFMKDKMGNEVLTERGEKLFRHAIVGYAVNDPNVIASLGENNSVAYRAFERSLGYITRLKAFPELDLTQKIVEALHAAVLTLDADPGRATSGDKWAAAFRPDQMDLGGMERELPPEPDRVTEALWRALHSSNAAQPRTFSDRMKRYIGDEEVQEGFFGGGTPETPTERFNRVFSKELREVQFSRSDAVAGVTQEEFEASLKGKEFSEPEREAAEDREDGSEPEVPAAAVEVAPPDGEPQTDANQAESKPNVTIPEGSEAHAAIESEEGSGKSPNSGRMEPPSKVDSAKEAEDQFERAKEISGYVTAKQLGEFLSAHPGTKSEASTLIRMAHKMAEYVFDLDPPEGVSRKNALDWVLRERVAGLGNDGQKKVRQGRKTVEVRGEYSDTNIEQGFGTGILKLHQAADPTTFLHEFAHVLFPLLSQEDLVAIDTMGTKKWDGKAGSLKGDVYAALSEKLAHGLEQFLRDENPTGFTSEMKVVLKKVKAIMRKVYLAFTTDPLSKFTNTEESKEVFTRMLGITDLDVADQWREVVKKARAAEAKKMVKPSEEVHPLSRLATDMGAQRIATQIAGKVEDSVGERIDPRKPTVVLSFDKAEDAAAAWLKVGVKGSKIQDAELVHNPEGEWGIRFNQEKEPPKDVLHQTKPEEDDKDVWYLKSEHLLEESKSPQGGSGEQWSAYFRNKGVKADEMKWTGLDEFLEGKPKVSKAEVQDYIRQNKVEIKEVQKGAADNAKTKEQWGQEEYGRPWNELSVEEQDWAYNMASIENLPSRDQTKYEQYTLPGEKDNYRELLLTLPERPLGKIGYRNSSGDPVYEDGAKGGNFQSSHWDEPNILAHIRFDERTDEDGQRVLLLEEVQSDWHQKGKKYGYAEPKTVAALKQQAFDQATELGIARETLRSLLEKADLLGYDRVGQVLYDISTGGLRANDIDETGVPGLRDAAQKVYDANVALIESNQRISKISVPDAPFKQNWHEMAMRRMLRYAAEHGFAKIAWVTGEQTAERYDLSKTVDEVIVFKSFTDDGFNVQVTTKAGHGSQGLGTISAAKLPEVVGKDLAEKIIHEFSSPDFRPYEGRNYNGGDLKVGGEWAKNLYDKAIPNYLRGYGKKWGATVGKVKIGEDTVHGMDVTPEMKFSVMEGQPLFQGLPEKHPGVKLEELEQQLKDTPSYKLLQRQLLQLKIDNLRNEIRSKFGDELAPQSKPELASKVIKEVKRGRETGNGVRKAVDGDARTFKPSSTGRVPKPAIMGMPHNAATRVGQPRPVTALSEVREIGLEPLANPRGNPTGMTVGQSFAAQAWVDGLKRSGLPENAPAPTWGLNPKTAAVLKFPGQKQVVQLAMSALEQGDGFVVGTATGSGKNYTGFGIINEFLYKNPDALILHITKNQKLIGDAQNVAQNSFQLEVKTGVPKGTESSGIFGASYAGLMSDDTYRNMKWDLVVADESGEARNWFQETKKNKSGINQGQMLMAVMKNAAKGVYLSATPFHSPMEYGYLEKLGLWKDGQFGEWIKKNFTPEIGPDGKVIGARLDPSKQAKLRQQLIERGQLVSQAISYDGYTAHFGVVPVTDRMKMGLDRIREGFARAQAELMKQGKRGVASKTAAIEAVFTKSFLERERLPQAIELAKQARAKGWQVMIFSEFSSDDLFHRERDPNGDPSTYQELDDAMGGQLSKIIPPFADVYDKLRTEFGDQIGDYSGRGNTMSERRKAMTSYLTGEQPMLYSTYAAGGIGVSLHDADYPELNVKGGERPRIAIFLGPPYSGVLLEQAMGRSWRFGVKSDTQAVFLATDSEPDIKLMQTKVGPRMRALRASVLGEKDSLASAMSSYSDEEKMRERQDALAYAEGNEVAVTAASFQVRSKTRNVGINDWSQINFPHADTAKNKGMKYGEEVAIGSTTSTLYQEGFMHPPDPRDVSTAKKKIEEIANAAVSGKVESVQNLDGAEREQASRLASAVAAEEVEIPVERDKTAVAEQAMESHLRNIPSMRYYGITLSQELGLEAVANREGKREVGTKLKLMNRSYRADYDTARAQYWNLMESILKQHGLYPDKWFESKKTATEKLDENIKQISLVMEGKLVSDNPAINKAAADMRDMMEIVMGDMAKAGVYVKNKSGEKTFYDDISAKPEYFPHRIDWLHEIVDPRDPTGQATVTLREIMKPKFDKAVQKRILESIPELQAYSYQQVIEYLTKHDPKAPALSHVERTRDINFPFIRRDYSTLIGYFDQVAHVIARTKNFGQELEKLKDETHKIKDINSRETINSMFRSSLEPQNWDDVTAKIYNTAIAYEALTKMTFSALKIPFHLVLVPLSMGGRVMPIAKALGHLALHPKEVMENAAYVGTITRQLNAADLMYGEKMDTPVRAILRKEAFEVAYKMVRTIAGEAAKVYLEQYALHELKKGDKGGHTRRLLKETFFIGDHGIDEAIRTGHFTQEEMSKAQTAFTNFTTFSDDPLQMPKIAREEIAKGESLPSVGLKRAVRLTYALQSFSVKATSLLREKLFDEVVIHGNLRPLAYAIVASPIIGQMLAATGTGGKHVVHRGMEGLMGKKHKQDAWDVYLKDLEDTFQHPTAVKELKFLIDGYTLGYGWEATRTVATPLLDMAAGNHKKAGEKFEYMMPDLVEHLIGSFYMDIFKTARKGTTIGQIENSQASPAVKSKKVKKSMGKWAVEQVPASRNIPQVEEFISKK